MYDDIVYINQEKKCDNIIVHVLVIVVTDSINNNMNGMRIPVSTSIVSPMKSYSG